MEHKVANWIEKSALVCDSSAAVTNYLNLYGFQSTIFHKACNLSIELDDKRYV